MNEDTIITVLKYFIVTAGVVATILGILYFLNLMNERDQQVKMSCLDGGGIYSTAAANTCVWSRKAID